MQKQEQAGLDNTVTNAALDGLTKGLTGLGSVFGSNPKQCEKLVEATAKELEALGL